MRKIRSGISIACLLIVGLTASSQDSIDFIQSQKSYIKYVRSTSEKITKLHSQVESATEKNLNQYRKKEEKLYRKLFRRDSSLASTLLGSINADFLKFKENISNTQKRNQYNPYFDTVTTTLKFLQSDSLIKIEAFEEATKKLQELEDKMHQAQLVKQFINKRRELLKEKLAGLGFSKQLRELNKEVYYYSEKLSECKQILKDRKKIERKVVDELVKTKVFRDFMKKNSVLASLFRMPSSDPADPMYMASLSGLQTRNQVQQLISGQVNIGGPSTSSQVSQNVQQAQNQVQQLKRKLEKGGGNDIMPEGFKPNEQRKKSFFERLELGTNIQTSRGSNFFPVTSDLGLSIGYKLNDKSIIGVGTSYKLGLGTGWRNIDLTHQGIGLRSFLDWKIKGSLWISGGYEQYYRSEIRSVTQLNDRSSWQKSGLVGLSKIISTKSKFFKKTKLQVLWDFLSYEQVPRTQPLLFRFGYNFK